MLNVVCSDSLKASLMQAQLGDVVHIGFYLDIGDISKEIDFVSRQEVFDQVWGDANFEMKEKEQFFAIQKSDYETMLMTAHKQESIRIWISDVPSVMCGFYFVCHALASYPCTISIIALPKFWQTTSQTLVSYSDWDEIHYHELKDFLKLEKRMSALEISFFAQRWAELKEENAPLRANVNGMLQSVPLDFYDVFIKRNLPEHDFPMAWLIGTVMGKEQIKVPYGLIANRIRTMIETRELIIVGEEKSMDPYTCILRKMK